MYVHSCLCSYFGGDHESMSKLENNNPKTLEEVRAEYLEDKLKDLELTVRGHTKSLIFILLIIIIKDIFQIILTIIR